MSTAKTAKLFMHGRSQAVRLPKEFRLPGTEVRVSRMGNRVVLEPIARSGPDIDAVFKQIDAILAGGEFPEPDPADDPPVQPDPRKFFNDE
jgi:antitoxin VapB